MTKKESYLVGSSLQLEPYIYFTMPSPRVPKEYNDRIYFLTFTVKRWYYLFDRHDRWNMWNILIESLRFCQKHKQLKIYSWVFMLNHLHLIIQSPDAAGFIRDFKKFTSKELKRNAQRTEPRVLQLFIEDGKYQFWQNTNMPEAIENKKFYEQKRQYIEQNPVRKQYVKCPEYWVYSSANPDFLLELSNIYEEY